MAARKRKTAIYRAGGDVKVLGDDIHSSGHAYKNDLQLMIDLLKNIWYRYKTRISPLAAHVKLRMAGIPLANIFLSGWAFCGMKKAR